MNLTSVVLFRKLVDFRDILVYWRGGSVNLIIQHIELSMFIGTRPTDKTPETVGGGGQIVDGTW